MSAPTIYDGLILTDPDEPPEDEFGAVPGSVPRGGNREPLAPVVYVDIAAMLDGGLPAAPAPRVLTCSDGVALFYAGQVNLVYGDPESGKSWLCLAAVAEALTERRRAVVLDLDHNGPQAIVSRLLDLGAPEAALRDLGRFRYAEPEDGAQLVATVRDLGAWRPHVAVVDSLGEVLPMFGASSNSPDEFTRVHGLILKPLAMAGAAVLAIDHLAKGSESRAMGPTGTYAKKRAVGGVSLRVTVADAFTPGQGGAAHLTIAKDRHGGLRAHRPTGDREPLAGTFRLYPDDHDRRWSVTAPAPTDRNPAETADAADVEALRALDPPPTSVSDAATRMKWRRQRAALALRALRDEAVPGSGNRTGTGNRTTEAPVPGSAPQGREPGTACATCHGPMIDLGDGATVHPACEVAS